MTYPNFLYNYVGSEGDHNTREFVDDLIKSGKLTIKKNDFRTRKMIIRLKKLAKLIDAEIILEKKS